MKNKAVFLDKDGTLIPDIPYNVDPEKITLAPYVLRTLQSLKNWGYLLIVVSNQAGVARGYFKEESLEEVERKINLLLEPAGISLDGFMYCPHHMGGDIRQYAIECKCRKPLPGMLLSAAKQYNIDLGKSWMVGDILHDVEAGNRAGCKTILLDVGNETEWEKGTFRNPIYTANDFNAVQDIIHKESFMTIPETIKQFKQKRITIIGDTILDIYSRGTSQRLSREAPVPIVDIQHTEYLPGGAANTALNVAALGAHTTFISVCGNDDDAQHVITALKKRDVYTQGILKDSKRITLAKNRIVCNGQQLARIDTGTTATITPQTEEKIIRIIEKMFIQSDAIILSDYGYGIFTPKVVEALTHLQIKQPKVIVADAKDFTLLKTIGITAIKPNYGEAIKLLGISPAADEDRLEQIKAHGRLMLQIANTRIAAITVDTKGALIFDRDSDIIHHTKTKPSENAKAAGAGDTFVSSLTLALTCGVPASMSADIAAAAAETVVQKEGTSVCTYEELSNYFSPKTKVLHTIDELKQVCKTYQLDGRKVVFTNGYFDKLHAAHIAYLERAKKLGDVLVVGVNTDKSTRRAKGIQYPVYPLELRMKVIAALNLVDYVVSFDEDTPAKLIKAIKPQVFVKGGDYTKARLPEASLVEQMGGRVHLLPYFGHIEEHHKESEGLDEQVLFFTQQFAQESEGEHIWTK